MLDTFSSEGKLLAVLIDPDKFQHSAAVEFLQKIPASTTHIFVGGSSVEKGETSACVQSLKGKTTLPVILFPGDYSQITPNADALLFLSLISGRNPEYLIGQQVQSINLLRDRPLDIIPTGYILVDGGKECAVQKISRTTPISQNNIQDIVDTALAGEFSGKKLIYLEAGSGAEYPVAPDIIKKVKENITIPLIVGGGIRSKEQLYMAYASGANMVVVGTAFENENFFMSF